MTVEAVSILYISLVLSMLRHMLKLMVAYWRSLLVNDYTQSTPFGETHIRDSWRKVDFK